MKARDQVDEEEHSRKGKRAVRYQACGRQGYIFLHPRSNLHSTAPEFVVYTQLISTPKRPYMAGTCSCHRVPGLSCSGQGRGFCNLLPPLQPPATSDTHEGEALHTTCQVFCGCNTHTDQVATWSLSRSVLMVSPVHISRLPSKRSAKACLPVSRCRSPMLLGWHAGVTAVEASWLADVGHPLCTWSGPLPDPPPAYEADADAVQCWQRVQFGMHDWPLPVMLTDIKDAKTRTAAFAVALLEGKVLPVLAGERYLSAHGWAVTQHVHVHVHAGLSYIICMYTLGCHTSYAMLDASAFLHALSMHSANASASAFGTPTSLSGCVAQETSSRTAFASLGPPDYFEQEHLLGHRTEEGLGNASPISCKAGSQ